MNRSPKRPAPPRPVLVSIVGESGGNLLAAARRARLSQSGLRAALRRQGIVRGFLPRAGVPVVLSGPETAPASLHKAIRDGSALVILD